MIESAKLVIQLLANLVGNRLVAQHLLQFEFLVNSSASYSIFATLCFS
jgi:hypothetical protein